MISMKENINTKNLKKNNNAQIDVVVFTIYLKLMSFVKRTFN